jgi:hypothetical protein
MWKAVLSGTTALAIAGSTLVYAQGAQRADEPQRWRPSADDISAFTDARIAGLKTGLKLNAEQEKHWPAVDQALRDLAKQRLDRMSARRDAQPPSDPIERLRRRADQMTETGAGLKKLADAAQPLYQSLDDGQKNRLRFLIRSMGPRRLAFMHGRHRWGEDRR